jgi:5-methylcytosine-specific restriction enzyme A
MEVNRLPTLTSIRSIIEDEAAEGTGATIMTRMEDGTPPSLQLGFADLGWKRTPRLHVLPHGMHAYKVNLEFGNFSRTVFERMNGADDESHVLAISLIEAAAKGAASLNFPQPAGGRLKVGPDFRLAAVSSRISSAVPEERIRSLSREIIVPILSALAELNGYDLIEGPEDDPEAGMEGSLKISVVRRRERNPRNRLLAIMIHGTGCAVCGTDHSSDFGFDTSLVEVHHLQPLGLDDHARPYDPRTDLVPLCPTCHRAAHKRRPLPYSVDELREMLRSHSKTDHA